MKQLKSIFLKSIISLSVGVTFAMAVAAVVICGVSGSTVTDDIVLHILIAAAVISAVEIPIVYFISKRLSKTIAEPINSIDPDNSEQPQVFSELTPLIGKIEAHNIRVAERINTLGKEHENQDAMRRDFTANVSHELKTPLTSISGYAEIIKNGIAKNEDVERFAGKIYDESQRLVTLVGDIIKLSQLDGKDIQVRTEKIDLYDTCSAVISQLEIIAKEKNVSFELCGEHIVITTAEQIVEEIIFNLCDNAVKYNRENGKVTVSLRQCVDGVELTVSDTGIGIPEEDIDHIFERFYRVDKSHSKDIGGTGLGLSIVKHGARYLGASVSLESRLGVGTTVRIVF